MRKAVLLTLARSSCSGIVKDSHLGFIAREILLTWLARIAEQRTVPDGAAIREALADLFPRRTSFLSPGDSARPLTILRAKSSASFGPELELDDKVLATITERLKRRGVRPTDRISRQAYAAPRGARFA